MAYRRIRLGPINLSSSSRGPRIGAKLGGGYVSVGRGHTHWSAGAGPVRVGQRIDHAGAAQGVQVRGVRVLGLPVFVFWVLEWVALVGLTVWAGGLGPERWWIAMIGITGVIALGEVLVRRARWGSLRVGHSVVAPWQRRTYLVALSAIVVVMLPPLVGSDPPFLLGRAALIAFVLVLWAITIGTVAFLHGPPRLFVLFLLVPVLTFLPGFSAPPVVRIPDVLLWMEPWYSWTRFGVVTAAFVAGLVVALFHSLDREAGLQFRSSVRDSLEPAAAVDQFLRANYVRHDVYFVNGVQRGGDKVNVLVCRLETPEQQSSLWVWRSGHWIDNNSLIAIDRRSNSIAAYMPPDAVARYTWLETAVPRWRNFSAHRVRTAPVEPT